MCVWCAYLLWMVYLCQALGNIQKFSIATPAWRHEGAALELEGDIYTPYCIKAREAAEESGARLVPLDMVFAQAWTINAHKAENGYLFTSDGTHFNQAGIELTAAAMLKVWNLS